MSNALLQTGFERVVLRVRNASDQAGRGVNTVAFRLGQRTPRVKAALVGVAAGG